MGDDQFEFRKQTGTGGGNFKSRPLLEKRLKEVAFVDFEKAFDEVEWPRMFQVLKKTEVMFGERRVF